MSTPWEEIITDRITLSNNLTIDVLYETKDRLTNEMLFEDAIRLITEARGWKEETAIEEIRKTYKLLYLHITILHLLFSLSLLPLIRIYIL